MYHTYNSSTVQTSTRFCLHPFKQPFLQLKGSWSPSWVWEDTGVQGWSMLVALWSLCICMHLVCIGLLPYSRPPKEVHSGPAESNYKDHKNSVALIGFGEIMFGEPRDLFGAAPPHHGCTRMWLRKQQAACEILKICMADLNQCSARAAQNRWLMFSRTVHVMVRGSQHLHKPFPYDWRSAPQDRCEMQSWHQHSGSSPSVTWKVGKEHPTTIYKMICTFSVIETSWFLWSGLLAIWGSGSLAES